MPDKYANCQSSDPANNQIRWMASKTNENIALTGAECAFTITPRPKFEDPAPRACEAREG